MFIKTIFYLALTICLAGTGYRLANWFRLRLGPEAWAASPWNRLRHAFGVVFKTLFSLRVFMVLRIFILDGLLQVRLLKADFSRWCIHMLIYAGFMGLLFMHGLDDWVTRPLFGNYEATLNPYLALRNIFGIMTVLGAGLAFFRRRAHRRLRAVTGTQDRLVLGILCAILISGFLLEAVKIVSEPVFDMMVADYAGLSEPEEVAPLQLYWAKAYGVVFENPPHAQDPEMLAQGRELHAEYCLSCHSQPQWAFGSYMLSLGIKPLAVFLNAHDADLYLWYIHVLFCALGLAWLPFSKFFHLITLPVNLVVDGMSSAAEKDPALIATRRAMGFEACVHCGDCSRHCAVEPAFRMLRSPAILPSEKLRSARALAAGRQPQAGLETLREAGFICTDCGRCTKLCPAGIRLKDLWQAARVQLETTGLPRAPHKSIKKLGHDDWTGKAPAQVQPGETTSLQSRYHSLTQNHETYMRCVQCQNCTAVCPVVGLNDDPADMLDLTPQQVMNLLRLGLTEYALGSRMVWDCLTCYQCQERCPQGIPVTDTLYELRNLAYARYRRAAMAMGPPEGLS